MSLNKSLTIRPLESADSIIVASFLRLQSPQYLRFFYAFSSDESAIKEMLTTAEQDIYSGIFWQAELVGIFFLRGWDAGFEIPSFGVLIDEKYRGGMFLWLTLNTANLICRLSGTRQLMAKIHPDNVSPRGASRLGFKQTGIEESTGNIIYHLDI